jgi:D-alanine-D-alanine ligase
MSHRTRVAVIRGGPSNEYEVSLNSGAAVLSALRKHFDNKYEALDLFIDRQRIWHMNGVPVKPEQAFRKMDVAFNALHGAYGEDGKIQGFFEIHGVPFTGSGSLASAVGMNKILSKNVFKAHGIKSPYWKEIASADINSENTAGGGDTIRRELFQSFLLPAIVKPVTSGSSVGVTLVRNYGELPTALAEAAKHSDTVMIEEFIPGIEATCGVIEGFRGHELYALPPIEIRPMTGFFDYEAKYQGKSEEIVPATFSDKLKKGIEELSAKIHRTLGLRHYSRSDFIIHPRRGIYALEVNTLPGLTEESLIPKSLRAVGSDTHELIDHLIKLALDE